MPFSLNESMAHEDDRVIHVVVPPDLQALMNAQTEHVGAGPGPTVIGPIKTCPETGIELTYRTFPIGHSRSVSLFTSKLHCYARRVAPVAKPAKRGAVLRVSSLFVMKGIRETGSQR